MMSYADANSPDYYRPGDRPRQRPPLNLDGLRFHPMPEIDESAAKFLAFLELAQKRMVDLLNAREFAEEGLLTAVRSRR